MRHNICIDDHSIHLLIDVYYLFICSGRNIKQEHENYSENKYVYKGGMYVEYNIWGGTRFYVGGSCTVIDNFRFLRNDLIAEREGLKLPYDDKYLRFCPQCEEEVITEEEVVLLETIIKLGGIKAATAFLEAIFEVHVTP